MIQRSSVQEIEYVIDPRQLRFLEAPSTVLEHETAVCQYLGSASKRIQIFSGEANCLVYSRNAVLDKLRSAYSKGVTIEMVLGPSISIWSQGAEPAIFDLFREKILTLYARKTRGQHSHYFICDEKEAWVQDYHKALAPLASRHSKLVDNKSYLDKLLQHFQLELEQATKVSNPADQLVQLTPVQMDWIYNKGIDLNSLNSEGFRRELEAYIESEEKAKKIAKTILQELVELA